MATQSRAFGLAKLLNPTTGEISVDKLPQVSVSETALTKSFTQNETYTIDFSNNPLTTEPIVNVYKEISRTGISTKGSWDVNSTASNYTLFNEAEISYSGITITPSSASTDGTFTLSSGTFNSSDVGKLVSGNGGSAIITATNGSYSLITAFTDTGTIAAGSWTLSGLSVDATNGLTISNISNIGTGIAGSYTVNYSNVSGTAVNNCIHGIDFNPDGTIAYGLAQATDEVRQHSLTTPWDLSTATVTNSFALGLDLAWFALQLSNDGTKMFVSSYTSDQIREYTLSTPWDVSTATFTTSLTKTDLGMARIYTFRFSDDGTKLFAGTTSSATIYMYELSNSWDLTSADLVNSISKSFGVTIQSIEISNDGSRLYIADSNNDSIREYAMSTAYDIRTATYTSQEITVLALTGTANRDFSQIRVVNNGRTFIGIFYNGSAYNEVSFTIAGSIDSTIIMPTNQYFPAVTNSSGQIDISNWIDINSMTADENINDGSIYYAISTDDHITWKIVKEGSGFRSIVRNNAGTWQYNNDTTGIYNTTEDWVNATNNSELSALQEALGIAINRMDSTQLEAVSDANQYIGSSTLDLMIGLYMGSGVSPTSDAISINYDAASIYKLAIVGTDYDLAYVSSTAIEITALQENNLKIKITR